MRKEFEVPEKWCIKDIPDPKILSDWLNNLNRNKFHWNFQSGSFYHFNRLEPSHCKSDKNNDYSEITFDDFNMYIFKHPEEDHSCLIDILKRLNMVKYE